jgi:hypothetical protein
MMESIKLIRNGKTYRGTSIKDEGQVFHLRANVHCSKILDIIVILYAHFMIKALHQLRILYKNTLISLLEECYR